MSDIQIKPWVDQSINCLRSWRKRYFIASDYKQDLPLTHKKLDAKIKASFVFKDDKTTTVIKFEVGSQSLVLKRYNPRSSIHKFKRALRRSRAVRCWEMSHVFARAGLNVARPVLMFEDRLGLVCKDTYFANEFMQGSELLDALPKMTDAEKSKVVKALKHSLDVMKSFRLSHGDMKATNLLWVNEELYFIDLDAASQHKSNRGWLRANRRDKKRFLKNWQSQPELLELFAWL